jgi:hypothetical protein
MAGPWGVLSVRPAAATTIVEGDIDGAPLGVLPISPAAATIVVEGAVDGVEFVDGRPPWGAHPPRVVGHRWRHQGPPVGVPIPSALHVPSNHCNETQVVVIDPIGFLPWAPRRCDD